MKTVQECIQLAIRNEIKSLSVADVGDFADQASNSPEQNENVATLIENINFGLTELYKEFNIRMREQVITHIVPATEYPLDPEFLHLVSATLPNGAPVPYNSSQILEEETNVFTNRLNIVTTEPYMIRIDGLVNAEFIGVLDDITFKYRASPVVMQDLTDNVPLTDVYLEALLMYVAYRCYMGVEASMETEDNIYYLRYKASVKMVNDKGLIVPTEDDGNKLFDRGFV